MTWVDVCMPNFDGLDYHTIILGCVTYVTLQPAMCRPVSRATRHIHSHLACMLVISFNQSSSVTVPFSYYCLQGSQVVSLLHTDPRATI